MRNFISLTLTTIILTANAAYAQIGDGYNEWNGRPVGCQMPVETELEVHATYNDDGVLMCAVEIESYSWWDLIGRSSWKNDFWFPCSEISQYTKRGSKVSGVLSWTYAMTCHQCRPGNHHTCTANFELD